LLPVPARRILDKSALEPRHRPASAENAIGGIVSSTLVESKSSQVVTVTLRAGTYTLFCSLYDHESLGMTASLEVR
jgi:uncharacterized cupredoxin-like copper-binding protein